MARNVKLVRTLTLLIPFMALLLNMSAVNGQIMRNEQDIVKAALRADKMRTLTSADKNSNPDHFAPDLLGDPNGIADRAKTALQNGIVGEGQSYNVSSVCLNDVETILQSLISGEQWAVRMIDAMGKPPSGILDGQFTWLGAFDECRAIRAVFNTTKEIKGRYCQAIFGKQTQSLQQQSIKLTIGLCVPNSCNDQDTTALVDTLLSLLPINTTTLPDHQAKCQLESLELDTKAIFVIRKLLLANSGDPDQIPPKSKARMKVSLKERTGPQILVICSIFGLVMVLATGYDIIIIHWLNDNSNAITGYEVFQDETERIDPKSVTKHYGTASEEVRHNDVVSRIDLGKIDLAHTQRKEIYQLGTLGKALLSFSVYTNVSKLLNTNQPTGTLSAVNGIRFLSMTWVVLGHSYGFGTIVSENTATFLPKMMERFTFQAIANATVAVDTFFALSGLLVAYLSLKEMKKRGGPKKMNWAMFYFHRFWRLTPPYMLFLMFYVCLSKYWSDGPMWPQGGFEIDECKDTWWKNLLYINNIVDQDKQCMGWSWYLANDMQFYILSPLMLIPLYYSPFLGSLSCLSFLLISFISSGVISARDELGANIIGRNADKMMEDVYMKPWCRVGPYAVGIFAGYVLYKTNCRLRMPRILAFLGWLVASAIALLVLYGLYDSSGLPTLNVPVSAFYNATSRSAWGLAVCWVVVACATGNGGFINSLLSWKAIIPLSRLTYCSYLVHLVVMDTYFLSKRSLVYLTDLEEIYMFFGHLCATYMVAFVVSLTFESPMMGLEKALLGRSKNS